MNAGGRFVILQGLADFRKHIGGELTVTLLAGSGEGVGVHEMGDDLVAQAIGWLKARRSV